MDKIESNSTSDANLSDIDEIANLLGGEEADEDLEDKSDINEEAEEEAEDLDEDENQTEESNDEVNESEEDGDETWESALGLEEGQLAYDDDGNISGVITKTNGKSDTIQMKDLIVGYQNNKSFTNKSQALASERKEFDTVREQVVQDYKSKLENVGHLTKFLSDKLVSEYDNVNWEQLRVDNPAEYAATRQDYSMKAQELQQAQDAIAQEQQDQTTAGYEASQVERSKNLTAQRDQMIINNPTWTDKVAFDSAMSELKEFMSNQYGFGDNDFATVVDARVIELMKDAKSFREGINIGKKKTKKNVPKFQKSGSRSNRKKTSKLDSLTKRAKDSHGSAKRDAQTDAIAELLTG